MKDLKDIAKGIMLGLVIVFGFVIASLTGCSEAERLMPPPVATEAASEDPGVHAGCVAPFGYMPVYIGPEGGIVLKLEYPENWDDYVRQDNLPRIVMNPNCAALWLELPRGVVLPPESTAPDHRSNYYFGYHLPDYDADGRIITEGAQRFNFTLAELIRYFGLQQVSSHEEVVY